MRTMTLASSWSKTSLLAVVGTLLCSLIAYAAVYCPGRPGPRCVYVNNCPGSACEKHCWATYTLGWGECVTKGANSEEECTYEEVVATVEKYLAPCNGANCGTYAYSNSYFRIGHASKDTSPCFN
jgi:hypothetical protein